METRRDGEAMSPPPPEESGILLEDKGLVANLTDCLSFSPAFTLTGFETMNDKVLREMNERARRQLGNLPLSQPGSGSQQSRLPREKGSRPTSRDLPLSPKPMAPFGRDSRSPARPVVRPSTRSPSRPGLIGVPMLGSNPPPVKSLTRANSGLESPSKRLRVHSGAPLASPTSSMSQLSLGEKERLTQVSAARQQQRRENASPRRRQLHKASGGVARVPLSLSTRPLPSLKLDQPLEGRRAREPVSKQVDVQGRLPRKLDERASPALVPRGGRSISQGLEPSKPRITGSSSMRSVSATASSGARLPPPLPTECDSLPSYARPTKAALRRSQSTTPHQRQGLSQHLRPSTSSRSVSRLLH